MDAFSPVELFLKKRRLKNKRRKNKKEERVFVEIRTKSGGSIEGEVLLIGESMLHLAEFMTKKVGSILPFWTTHPSGRLAVIERSQIEAVFSDGLTAP